MEYRKIKPEDDAAIARIIRENLEKLGLDIPGTAYFDPFLDHISSFYLEDSERRAYYIFLNDRGEVCGGVGFAEFAPIPGWAELQKLYLSDEMKGKHKSPEMVRLVEEEARKRGYQKIYLETHSNLKAAIQLYEKLGYQRIPKPEAVVHSSMDHFYLKDL